MPAARARRRNHRCNGHRCFQTPISRRSSRGGEGSLSLHEFDQTDLAAIGEFVEADVGPIDSLIDLSPRTEAIIVATVSRAVPEIIAAREIIDAFHRLLFHTDPHRSARW